MWFYRQKLRISWTENVNSEEVLRRMGTKGRVIFRIKKRQAKFLGHMMRKDVIENITDTGHRT